ncbi:MAG: sensor histidine kinase [Spirochaetia bacterium]
MHRTICDFVLDLLQNSIEADSTLIILDIEETESKITFYLSDNGKGMDSEELAAAGDPFYTGGAKHGSRKVGLGIPFLVQAAEAAEGEFDISSEKGSGTSVKFSFELEHIDTPPVGSLPETYFAALAYPGDFEMVINRQYYGGSRGSFSYTLERSVLRDAVGGFEEAGSLKLLRTFLRSQEETAAVRTAGPE